MANNTRVTRKLPESPAKPVAKVSQSVGKADNKAAAALASGKNIQATVAKAAAKVGATAQKAATKVAATAEKVATQVAQASVQLSLAQESLSVNVNTPVSQLPTAVGSGVSETQVMNDIARSLGHLEAPNWMFGAEEGKTWSMADLQALKATIGKMSEADRKHLMHTSFQRVGTLGMEDGKPDYGHVEFGSTRSLEARSVVKIADVASAEGVVADVAAHEIGHIVMGKGKWDSNSVREFGKLSHWVRGGQPETLVDGYDEFFRAIDLEAADHPKDAGNFVSPYAKESAVEDYAESYRYYISNPGELMAKAPDKFLYLNAQSGKYSPEQVQQYANIMGVNLPLAMAELARTDLRPGTLADIAAKNGLAVPGPGSGAGDAMALIHERAADPAFSAALRSDPRAALGDELWGRLSPSEQAVFAKPGYAESVLAAAAANRAAPRDAVQDGDVATWRRFMLDLLNDPPAAVKVSLTNAGESPESRARKLSDMLHDPKYWGSFSEQTRALFDSANGKAFIGMMASDATTLDITKLAWNTRTISGQYFTGQISTASAHYATIKEYLEGMGPADFDAITKIVSRGVDADTARQISDANRKLAKTGNAAFAGPIPGM
ncbi:MAG: hypothetical protein FJZ01_01065 [Candidatus Sericytochromatia bacterium]|nr:hypothetical protein [Candidatus Tanganyikabacteria bacterium]